MYGSIWVSVCVYVYASRWLAAAALACCFIGAPIQVVQFIYAGMVMDDCAVPEGRERERARKRERARARARAREREMVIDDRCGHMYGHGHARSTAMHQFTVPYIYYYIPILILHTDIYIYT